MLNVIRAKCLIIGDNAVGKTAFLNSFVGDGTQFLKNYIMTQGIDIHEKLIRIPDSDTAVQLFFFDCSGKEFYRPLMLGTVKARTGVSDPLKGVLLGNKIDLTSRRRVSSKAGHDLAHKLGLTYFEGSAKENKDIEGPFFFLANEWFKIYSENEQTMKMIQ